MLKPTTDIQLLGADERQKTEQLQAKDQPIGDQKRMEGNFKMNCEYNCCYGSKLSKNSTAEQ